MLNSFGENLGLKYTLLHDKAEIDYSYNFNMSRFSILDHFLLSETLYTNSVDNITVMHDVDNMSDHDPILLQFSMNLRCIGFAARIHTPRVSWAKATDAHCCNYRFVLSAKLQTVAMPVEALLCKDVKCSNLTHFQLINKYAIDITNACLSAAEKAIPLTCSRGESGRIPGWSEYVKPLRDKSLF